jgi:F-type H+-transporting ATPase subunit b
LITVNLTMVIQLVTFLALIVLLNHLLFQPVLRVIDRRDKVLRDNHARRDQFTRLAEEKARAYDEKILSSRQEAVGLRNEARAQAAAALRGMVQKTREENLARLEGARRELAVGAEQARAGMKAQVEGLAAELSASLLGRPAVGKTR